MPENNTRVTIYDSRQKQNLASYLQHAARELYFFRYAYYNFVIKTLSTRYRRSALGFLWTLISPLMNLTILAIVFSLVFKQEIRIFGVYIFSALTPWTFISTSLYASPTIFIYAEGYIKKVYIPKFLFPLTQITVEAINFFFSMLSIYIIFLFLGAKLSWMFLLTPLPMIITFIFVLGLSMLISVAHVYFRDVSHITQMVVSALMFTLPIMYPVSKVPVEYQYIFLLNPFFHFINLFRVIIYDASIPTLNDWLIPLGIALFTLLLGFFVLMKQDRDLVFRL